VVGTGGASLHPFEKRSAGSVVRNGRTFGVLKLTLHPKRYEWRFVGEAGSSFTDAGSASCHH
jgi:alkaline phosphatase